MSRLNFAARSLLSFITFYLGWWACALGASYGKPWIGPALLPIWIFLHIFFSPTRWGESFFFIAISLYGFTLDTILIQLGLIQPIGATSFSPAWLVAMWALWGLSFESMGILRKKPLLLVFSGAVSGPIAYFAGEPLQILFYARPLWQSIAIHSVIWAFTLPTLFKIRDLCQHLATRGGGVRH